MRRSYPYPTEQEIKEPFQSIIARAGQAYRLARARVGCHATEAVVKYTDDYQAKYRIWAAEGKVCPLPRCVGWPDFRSKKFSSYEEMNAWKRELLLEVARKGGVRWTK